MKERYEKKKKHAWRYLTLAVLLFDLLRTRKEAERLFDRSVKFNSVKVRISPRSLCQFFRQRSRPRTFGWNYFRVLESSRLDLQLGFTKFHRLLFAAFWPIRLIIMQQIKQRIKLDWIISLSIRIAMELTELSSRTPHHLPSTRSFVTDATFNYVKKCLDLNDFRLALFWSDQRVQRDTFDRYLCSINKIYAWLEQRRSCKDDKSHNDQFHCFLLFVR